MAITTGSLIEIALDMNVLGNQNMNVYQYEAGTIPPSILAVHIAEAWWNHVKVAYRALATSAFSTPFQSIRIRELNNNAGDYAEYDIPTAEKSGTRASPSEPTAMPPFSAAGVRLVVGTRLTRPGQKRLPFLTEGDNSVGLLGSAYTALTVTLMNILVANMTLGAPAATAVLKPVVTRKDAQGFVTAYQPVTGFLVNADVTTQNTRKFGRGS